MLPFENAIVVGLTILVGVARSRAGWENDIQGFSSRLCDAKIMNDEF
jgi:hypothetical protein